jgi:hypothetical protein
LSIMLAAGVTLAPSNAWSRPYSTQSYYEKDANPSTLYSQGCASGQSQAQGVKILDFGRPAYNRNAYGTIGYAGAFIPNSAIIAASQGFARGYYHCLPSRSPAHIALAVGTNNSCPNCSLEPPSSYKAGENWAFAIEALQRYLTAHGISDKVRASAADDIEPSHDPGYSASHDFVAGYSAISGYTYPLWNFGSLDSGYWSPAQLHYVTWGAKPAVPFGEIYASHQAQEWQDLNLWSVKHTGRALHIFGVTALNHGARRCGLSDDQAYNTMVKTLQSNPQTYQHNVENLTTFPCQ